MTDFDLDRLGDMWRQEPDPAEIAALRRAAEDIARNARRSQIIDAATAIAVSLAVMVLAWSNPKAETIVIGGAAIMMMLYSSVRQRQLRKAELQSLTGTTEEMLDQSIARAKATLKRTKLGLLATPPALGVGIGFGAALDSGDGGTLVNMLAGNSNSMFAIAAILVFIMTAGFIYYSRMIGRTRVELSHFLALREAFDREQDEIAPDI